MSRHSSHIHSENVVSIDRDEPLISGFVAPAYNSSTTRQLPRRKLLSNGFFEFQCSTVCHSIVIEQIDMTAAAALQGVLRQ